MRTKFLATLLGPVGIGLIGIYDSITGIARTVADMGIQTSGVRQTAEAAATNDQNKIALTSCQLLEIFRSSSLLNKDCSCVSTPTKLLKKY